MRTKSKVPWVVSLIICVTSLAVGASFHRLRMHPENVNAYRHGCTMGVVMASIAAIAFAAFIVLFVRYRKGNKKSGGTENDR